MFSTGRNAIRKFGLYLVCVIGKAVVVASIAGIYSLFTLCLSYLLLGHVERISLKMVVVTILIGGGVILLSLAK